MSQSRVLSAVLIVFGVAGLLASTVMTSPAQSTPRDYVFAMRIAPAETSAHETRLPRANRPALNCETVYRVALVEIGHACRPVGRETAVLDN